MSTGAEDAAAPETVVGSSEERAVQLKRTSDTTGIAARSVKPVIELFSIHHSLPTLPCGVAFTAGVPVSGVSKTTVTDVPVFAMTANPA